MLKSNIIISKKNRLRKEILGKLRSQNSLNRHKKSAEIKEKLINDNAFKANCIMFYISKDYEVSTDEAIKEALKQSKRIIVPVTSLNERKLIPSEIKDYKAELEKGPFGIREPKKEYIRPIRVDDIDAVITPGIAFDTAGNRVGHGMGYYDSFLKTLPRHTATVGLAFGFQIVDKVPILSWDVPVQKVISA